MIEWWNLSEMEMDKMSEIWLISDEINVGYFAGGYSKVRDFVTVSAEISQQTKFKSLTYPPTKKPSNTSIKKGKIITVILLLNYTVLLLYVFSFYCKITEYIERFKQLNDDLLNYIFICALYWVHR